MDDDDLTRPLRRMNLSPERFMQPLGADRPGMRWWWQTPVPPVELVRELRAIAAAGFGEVEIAFSPGFWADDAQCAALTAVLEAANGLGVGVAMTLGAAWPLQTPNTTRGTAHAALELQYGVRYVEGVPARPVMLPRPFDDPEEERPTQLLAVVTARVLRKGGAPTIKTVQEPWGSKTEIVGPTEPTILEAASLTDLTTTVADGSLPWVPRIGEWAVLAFWVRESEQGVTSFIDRQAAVAATDYLDEHQIGTKNRDLLRDSGTELFEDSLELNADSLFWSRDLPERFAQRHGYDLITRLPALFAQGMCRYWVPNEEPVPDFELDDGSGSKIRRDYYRLLTDLYISDHLLVLQAWSVSRGMRHKAQVAYGAELGADQEQPRVRPLRRPG